MVRSMLCSKVSAVVHSVKHGASAPLASLSYPSVFVPTQQLTSAAPAPSNTVYGTCSNYSAYSTELELQHIPWYSTHSTYNTAHTSHTTHKTYTDITQSTYSFCRTYSTYSVEKPQRTQHIP